MIEVQQLTKRYGTTLAVDDLTFTVRPGHVTGFLGPNGAGKSTTMRMILGLDHPTSGQALVLGRPYQDLPAPLCSVGALLDAGQVHPRRSAQGHLRSLAATLGEGSRRVQFVLDTVGLGDAGGRRVGTFSLGMRQRLGVAAAILGDPEVVILDEPVNGLDPEGVIWIRTFMRGLAAEGRTVLVSSHLMSEMAQTADHLLVVGRGRLVADVPTDTLLRGAEPAVRVVSPTPDDVWRVLERRGPTSPRETATSSSSRGWERRSSPASPWHTGSSSTSWSRIDAPSSRRTSNSPTTPSTTGPGRSTTSPLP